jgi:Peptidase C13 family/YcxB-like protein
MRIELEHTREDWLSYVRYVSLAAKPQQRRFWFALVLAIVVTVVVLWIADEVVGRRLDSLSVIVGVGLIFGIIAVIARLGRTGGAVPESWLGPQVWELRADGLHTSTRSGSGVVAWSAVKGIHETESYLYLRLDDVVALSLPKRYLASLGGPAAVRAEIDRLMSAEAAVESSPTSASSGGVASEPATSGATAEVPSAPAPPSDGTGTTPSTPATVSARGGSVLGFLRNLVAGARLALFVPVRREHFTVSARQAVLLGVLTIAAWILIDRLGTQGEAEIIIYAVGQVLGLAAIAVAFLVLCGPGSADPRAGITFMTAVAAAAPILLIIGLLCALPDSNALWCRGLMLVLPLLTIMVLYRAHRIAADELVPLAVIKAIVAVAAVWWTFGATLYVQPSFWYVPDAEAAEGSWTDSERDLFAQPDLVDRAVAALKEGAPGVTEAYWVGFAGHGEQRVFAKEVQFAGDALARRLDIAGRSLQLVNSPDTAADAAPLATVSGLRRALAGVAARMNTEEDVLILFLTSHGSEDAELSVSKGELPVESLRGPALRAALDDAGIRWRIIVISACHSGSFIPHLADEYTLIATAARADRSSFGCTDERELTYYGEALFRDALPASNGFLDAFERARRIVGEHERKEKVEEYSEPQLSVGARMRSKLAELQFRAAS